MGKHTKRNALIVIAFLCMAVGIGMLMQTGSIGGVADSIPLEITVANIMTGAAVNTGTNIFIYRGGVLVESLDTGADGIVQGVVTYDTGEVLQILITATNMIPVYTEYLVPFNTKNLDYWKVSSFSVYPAATDESVYVTDYTLAEKNAVSGSAWNCTPSLPFLMTYWYCKLGTNQKAAGGQWYLPVATEQYPQQRTYAIIKLTDANGYASGMTIAGWSLSQDMKTYYREITDLIVYDIATARYGVMTIPAYVTMPQSMNTRQVMVTYQIISQADPAELAAGNYASTGLTWDDADDAGVYIGMEA